MKLLLPISLVLLLFVSCEKKIDFPLNLTEPKLVVEASIESGGAPLVVLTTSLDYFGAVSTDSIQNSFVKDAEVYVSNGTLTHQLKLYEQPLGPTYNLYYYSLDSSNPATAFLGEIDHEYSLRIRWKGNEYNATTTIPPIRKSIDSLYSVPAPPTVDSSKKALLTKVTDFPGLGDYVRYYTRVNNEPFLPGLNSVFDDQIIDGTSYELEVIKALPRDGLEREEEDFYFDVGDTVTLKISGINKQTYDFWRTMEFSYASVGNPFSSPTKVLGNIDGGALGYFGGYAVQTKTVVVTE